MLPREKAYFELITYFFGSMLPADFTMGKSEIPW
jgi:hypothetical protein